jgi:hypothetical protein
MRERRRFCISGTVDRTGSLLEQAMQNPIIRTFKQLSSAEQARQELLAAGVAADDVAIDMLISETGAVQGNFTVGDDPEIKGKTAYTDTFAPTAQDDVRDCMITVNAADTGLAQRAEAILERHGALDPDPAHHAVERNRQH